MKALDFRDRLLLVLSVNSDYLHDGEVNYPQFLAIKRGIQRLLEEAGSESRCAHDEKLYDGIICIRCGRKPSRDNTLPPPPEAA